MGYQRSYSAGELWRTQKLPTDVDTLRELLAQCILDVEAVRVRHSFGRSQSHAPKAHALPIRPPHLRRRKSTARRRLTDLASSKTNRVQSAR
eukprot:scaffold42059_cov67-Phaeocystis_antarctica.AAC.3